MLKDLFTKWVGVHHYAHPVSSCSKSREGRAGDKEEVSLGFSGAVTAAVGSSTGKKHWLKEKELSAVRAKDSTQRIGMPLVCPLLLVGLCTGETAELDPALVP